MTALIGMTVEMGTPIGAETATETINHAATTETGTDPTATATANQSQKRKPQPRRQYHNPNKR